MQEASSSGLCLIIFDLVESLVNKTDIDRIIQDLPGARVARMDQRGSYNCTK